MFPRFFYDYAPDLHRAGRGELVSGGGMFLLWFAGLLVLSFG